MSFRSAHSHKVNATNQIEVDIAAQSLAQINVDLDKVNGSAVSLGQAVAGSSIPVVLPSATDVPVNVGKWGGAAIDLGQENKAGSVPVTLASDEDDVNVNLAAVGASALDLGQENKAGSIPVVIASDQDALAVSLSTAQVSGTEGNMESNQSVALNDTSTVIDVRQATNITIFGDGTSLSDNITIEVSADNSNFYPMVQSIFPSNNKFFERIENAAFGYIRLKWGGSATAVYATCQYR